MIPQNYFSGREMFDKKFVLSEELTDGTFYMGYIIPNHELDNPTTADAVYVIEKITKTTDANGTTYQRFVAEGRYNYVHAWDDRASLTYKMR